MLLWLARALQAVFTRSRSSPKTYLFSLPFKLLLCVLGVFCGEFSLFSGENEITDGGIV
jgi:hypothetical protein